MRIFEVPVGLRSYALLSVYIYELGYPGMKLNI